MVRLTRRQARRLALQRRAADRARRRKIQAQRIAARRKARAAAQRRGRGGQRVKLSELRRGDPRLRGINPFGPEGRKRLGIPTQPVLRDKQGRIIAVGIDPIESLPRGFMVTLPGTRKTKAQIRRERLSARLIARRRARAAAAARKRAARRAAALRRRRRR